MSKIVILLRHTKAQSAEYPLSDFDRKLSNEGKACASFMADKLSAVFNRTAATASSDEIDSNLTLKQIQQIAKTGPQKIICSSSRRTRETLQHFQLKFATDSSDIEFTEATYEASTGNLLNQLQQLPAEVESVLMVGHNPGTEFLAELLITDRLNLSLHFSTGTIAVIAFENLVDWRDIGSTDMGGSLVHYLNPKKIGWSWGN